MTEAVQVEKILVENLSTIQVLYYLCKVFEYGVVSSKMHGRTGPKGATLFRGPVRDLFNGRHDNPLPEHIASLDYTISHLQQGIFDIEYLHDEDGTWEITSKIDVYKDHWEKIHKVIPTDKIYVTRGTDFKNTLFKALIKHTYGEMVEDV